MEVNRPEAARYGLTVGDVQRAITSGIGGENIAENVEGRERYPINVRYAPDFRDDLEKLERVVIATPSNAQVPLGELAKVSFSKGPTMIRDEDAALTGYVYLDLNTRDYGGFVDRAEQAAAGKTRAAGRLQLQVVRRIRIRAAREGAAEDHLAGRLLRDLSAAVHGLPFRHGSAGSDLPDGLCDDRRAAACSGGLATTSASRCGSAISLCSGSRSRPES